MHIAPAPAPKTPEPYAWDSKSRIYHLGGVDVELYTVGQLADALDREAVTIRKWERDGILPKAMFNSPSTDPRGRRRLYSRAQVEGIVKIAKQEGIYSRNSRKPIRSTAFTAKVIDLFKTTGAPA